MNGLMQDDDFLRWLWNADTNPGLMTFLTQLYQLDHQAKDEGAAYILSIEYRGKVYHDPAKRRIDPITINEIIDLEHELEAITIKNIID
jgi:hypothetical protein